MIDEFDNIVILLKLESAAFAKIEVVRHDSVNLIVNQACTWLFYK
jgi:hypothetical protein